MCIKDGTQSVYQNRSDGKRDKKKKQSKTWPNMTKEGQRMIELESEKPPEKRRAQKNDGQ